MLTSHKEQLDRKRIRTILLLQCLMLANSMVVVMITVDYWYCWRQSSGFQQEFKYKLEKLEKLFFD